LSFKNCLILYWWWRRMFFARIIHFIKPW